MDIPLAHRVRNIQPSPTLAVTAKAAALKAAGKDIIGLGAGEPDFDTPVHIKAAAIDAIERGLTKYTAVEGTLSLRQAIVQKFWRDNQLRYTPDQILVSCGAKQSFFNLTQAFLNPGDEVIIPAPYWVSYPDMVLLAEAIPVIVSAGIEQQFKIRAEQLEKAITPKTRLFILNSPSNPTGMVYSEVELKALAEVLRQHPQILIATDDIYEKILWSQAPFQNIVNVCPELYERTVVVNGVSKAYAMTGWRIGFAAGPKPLIETMTNIQGHSTSNPCSIAQAAAEMALKGDQACITPMVQAFKTRHDFVIERLKTMPALECLPAQGAFYSFFKTEAALKQLGITDDVAFSEFLLSETGVALVPGSAFGAPGYQRLSFATSLENLDEALKRLKKIIPG